MSTQELERTINDMVGPGKGVLAADESSGTIEKRFKSVDVASTEENRRDYREILFTAPGLGQFVGGVILFDETIRQKTAAGTPMPEVLTKQGMVPGIKVDKGPVPLPFFPGETFTQGLDGLAARLTEYKGLGARFAKWRAVIPIGHGIPTPAGITANAEALARYAGLCQDQGLVPIVEPEVLMDGSHTLADCARVTQAVQHAVFDALQRYRVRFEHMILKPNMVIPGKDCPQQASPEEVAQSTLTCLRRTVPAAVPCVAFLSGGQSDEAASANLNAINALAGGKAPWILTFSYSRALQAAPLKTWRGQAGNREAAQQALLKRARLNSAAAQGSYSTGMEKAA